MNWLHIDAWLLTIYKENNNIPHFKRTNKNYDILNSLKNLNLNSIELVETIISSSKDHENTLAGINNLSAEGRHALDSLASNAYLLGLDKTELSNYITAITKLSIQQTELNIEEASLNEIEYKIDECQKAVTKELGHMKNILTKLQQHARDDNNGKEQMIIQKRILEGTNQLKRNTSEYVLLKSKYNDLHIERKGIRLNHLNDLDSKANLLEAELKEKNAVLASYQGLPSEMVLASIKIQETQDLLHELEFERENLLSEIANSVH